MHLFADITAYWNSFALDKSEMNKPIYMWDCFNINTYSIKDLEDYIHEIAGVLNTYRKSNGLYRYDEDSDKYIAIDPPFEMKIYATLYLVRCALICRLADDWDLIYRNEFNDDLGLANYGNIYWGELIGTAERGLGRPPLDCEDESKHYCARILTEAGFPLRSLQNKNSKVVRGLRSIQCLLSGGLSRHAYEKILQDFIASSSLIKNDNRYFWLPGGKAGCRIFFRMGLNLLERVSSEYKKRNGEVSEIEILKEFGFDNPSEDVVDSIFKNHGTVSFSFPKPAIAPAKTFSPKDSSTNRLAASGTDNALQNTSKSVTTKISSTGTGRKIYSVWKGKTV